VACTGGVGKAPDFELEVFGNENYTRGELLSLSDLEGRPVVVNFWYPSCPPCVIEMPDFEKSFQAHKSDGLQFIGVQLLGFDSVEEGQQFITDFGINFAVGPDPDGRLVVDYMVMGAPTTVFLNESHEEVRRWVGPLTAEKLEEIIQQLLQ
jgi:peroxiredoxin